MGMVQYVLWIFSVVLSVLCLCFCCFHPINFPFLHNKVTFNVIIFNFSYQELQINPATGIVEKIWINFIIITIVVVNLVILL